MMLSYNPLELAVIGTVYSIQKWKEEKLIVLVEKHKAMCEKICPFIQNNI